MERFALSSTSSAAAAYAWGVPHYPELSARDYVSEGVPETQLCPKTEQMEIVRVRGDFVEAGSRSRAEVRPGEAPAPEGAFFHLGWCEGAKFTCPQGVRRRHARRRAHRHGAPGTRVRARDRRRTSGRAERRGARLGALVTSFRRSADQLLTAGQGVPCRAVRDEGAPLQEAGARPYSSDPAGRLVLELRRRRAVGAQVDRGFIDVTSSAGAAAVQRHNRELPLGDSVAVALANVYRIWGHGHLCALDGVLVALRGSPGR